jgi:pyrimidine-nucleoside phosphorylase
MRVYDIILKKRNGARLSKQEINFMIEGCCKEEIPDYQMAAFLMAVYFKGMLPEEATDLTLSMVDSGERVDLSAISGFKVDKHSTGGVGDTTTLVLGPIVAAAGGKVAKMTGRGLGHTGGTIDKLETIPGFKTSLTRQEFIDNVNRIGLALMGQTAELAPADKKLYALRDVTATVDSIPLIAGSILSKKLAAGADGIVLDVKTGSGAFMVKYSDALALAEAMVAIGEGAGRRMVSLITSMEEPLGCAIGNSIEVEEAINTLKGQGPKDLEELCIELGANMLVLSEVAEDVEEARTKLKEVINNGKGLEKLKEMVQAQGGNPQAIDNPKLLPQCKEIIEVKSPEEGYVDKIDAFSVGVSSQMLGAGRQKKEDVIDPSVGIILKKKIGDRVDRNHTLAVFHTDGDRKKIEEAKEKFLASYTIGQKETAKPRFFYARVTKKGVEEWK